MTFDFSGFTVAYLRKRYPSESAAHYGMFRRCKKEELYILKNIQVCERWKQSFRFFLEDMGPKPTQQHSVDRIDNDGNYEPGNCRWATDSEQQQNTRKNKKFTFNGECLTLFQWAKKLGLKKSQLKGRIQDGGWSVEKALTTPFRPMPKSIRTVTLNGVTKSIVLWSEELNLSYQLIDFRIKKGLPAEEILSTIKKTAAQAGKMNRKKRPPEDSFESWL